jgi:hypothetical protein
MVYSYAARLERGETKQQILAHAIKRSLILIAIGLLVNASPIIGLDLHTWRFEGMNDRQWPIRSPLSQFVLTFGVS